MRFLQGASPELVTEMLGKLPPFFFVVGAPRCGATALSKALGGHPRISFSKPKETHFLTEDHAGMSLDELRRFYLEHFQPNFGRDTLAIGDGSVSYLYSLEAIRRALEFDPRAKFIVSVRSPVQMLRSYHARLLLLMDEDETDFDQAWDLQEARRLGHHIPPRCREPMLLQYGDVAQLGRYVGQLFEVAGRERCHVVVFDDFIANPGAVYRELLDFLGVEFDGRTEFKQKRGNAQFRSKWLQRLTMNPRGLGRGRVRPYNRRTPQPRRAQPRSEPRGTCVERRVGSEIFRHLHGGDRHPGGYHHRHLRAGQRHGEPHPVGASQGRPGVPAAGLGPHPAGRPGGHRRP
jgi:hypothetical protein